MKNNNQTMIVIPCYNEATRLNKDAFLSFSKDNSHISLLFVNDGSIDDTQGLLDAMREDAGDNIFVLHLRKNSGKAEAVRMGFLYAYQNFTLTYIGFWDADLATPLNEINDFINIIDNSDYDIVTGLRLLRLGAKVKRKVLRHFLGRIFATVVANSVLKINVYDTQCGAKLFRSILVPDLFSSQFVSKWFFDIEILARYIKAFQRENASKKIYEYPVFTWNDIGGSKLKLKDFFTVPLELVKIKKKYF
jgi:glycosyltransferase involved in cell wall biosynthesis